MDGKKFLVGLLCVAAASCGVTDVDDERADRLEAARQLWESNAPESYSYVFRASCECLPSFTSPARIQVRAGEIESVVAVSDGEPVPVEPYRTIDELFDLIADALDRGTADFHVEYDAQYGYPTVISIDYDRGIADDEFAYWASELAPL